MLIFLSYKVNQDYISAVLCKNRAKPELSCNGKCILADQLKADEEKDSRDVPPKSKESKELLFWLAPPNRSGSISCAASAQARAFFPYLEPPKAIFDKGIFHPPSFVRPLPV